MVQPPTLQILCLLHGYACLQTKLEHRAQSDVEFTCSCVWIWFVGKYC